jgi:uncharacterized protein YkwD
MKLAAVIFSLLFVQLASSTEQPPQSETVCLSTEEKKLYDLMMAYRKSKKLKSIPLSAKLSKVAQTHARDLADHYEFNPDNKCNPHSWSKEGKWTACCYTSDHKQAKCMWDKPMEIAEYNSPGYEIAYYSSLGASAQEGLEGWKRSPAHNPLIINEGMWSKAEWKAVGIGMYKEYGVVWFGQAEDASPTPSTCN